MGDMALRFATTDEITTWNEHLLANPDGGNILQSLEMAEQKTLGNWKPRYIISDTLAILVLEKSVPFLGKLWYVMKGPGVTTVEELTSILPGLKSLAAKSGVFTVKIEPEIIKTDDAPAALTDLGLVKSRDVQPNVSTVLLDLSGSVDEIMANLNQKGRHAIRRAERDGAVVKQVPATDDNCRMMYDLYLLTAEGQFPVRSYSYYKHFWQTFERAQTGQMFFAYADDRIAAAAYALIFGSKSTYKDGASLRERPVYGMSHFLQWNIITWAKSRGATVHDFCSTPPSDQIKNPDHPFYGFGRFKTSFNKDVIDFVGAYDIIIRPTSYRIWSHIGERIALRLHWQRHHESYY